MPARHWSTKKTGVETYLALEKFLKEGRNPKYRTWPHGTNTTIEEQGYGIGVSYRGTVVFHVWPDGQMKLNTGGWFTVTTKARMNEFLPFGYMVYQEKKNWFVQAAPYGFPYFDGIVLPNTVKSQKDVDFIVKQERKRFGL